MTEDRDDFEGPAPARRRPRTPLEVLSLELNRLADWLANYAGRDADLAEAPAAPPDSARLDALIAARRAIEAGLGPAFASPGWSLLAELYRARLAGEPARLAALAAALPAAPATLARRLARLESAGLAARGTGPLRGTAALTDAGAEAMADYFGAAGAG